MTATDPPALKAVIFDIDGTLLDSVDAHAQAWQDAFREFGHDIPLAALRREIGKGGDQLLPVFLSRAEIEARGETLEARRGALLKANFLPHFRPFPRAADLLRRLSDDGITILLATSSKSDESQTYKDIIGIADLVGEDVSSEDAEKSKPEPDIFHAALQRLPGVDPGAILVVGDTPHDARAAAKAGLRTIGVLCGGVDEAALRDGGCVAVFRDPADLLANYGAWTSARP